MDGSIEGPGSALLTAVLGGIVLGVGFAALDAALASLGEVRLRAYADGKGVHAATAARALRQLDRLQARLLAGRVLCVTAAAAIAAFWAVPRGGLWASLGAAVAVALVFSVMTEIASTVARQRAGAWTLGVLKWFRPIELLMLPLALPLEWLGRTVERAFPEVTPEHADRVTALGIERMIEEGLEDGALEADHADLLHSVLEFKNTLAHEVMIPRTRIVAFDLDESLREVIGRIIEQGHSRYPVYEGRVDQVIGVLYAKDLFAIVRERESVDGVSLAELIRKPAFFCAETQKIDALLKEMQAKRVHLAIVVDEYGGTAGIVTLEDILEEIVGEIRDEYDREDTGLIELEDDRWMVNANISIYDLEDQLGVRFRDDDSDYDSLGGMVVDLAGHVPAVGESVTASGYELTVKEADQRRVRRVEIRRSPTAAAE